MPNRIGREIIPPGRHKVDKNLPGHWTRIEEGQSTEARSAAIMYNITVDKELRSRGLDPTKAGKGRSAVEALHRVQALK